MILQKMVELATVWVSCLSCVLRPLNVPPRVLGLCLQLLPNMHQQELPREIHLPPCRQTVAMYNSAVICEGGRVKISQQQHHNRMQKYVSKAIFQGFWGRAFCLHNDIFGLVDN